MAMTGTSVRKNVQLQLGLVTMPVNVFSTLLTAEEKEAAMNTVCVGSIDHDFAAVSKTKDECKTCHLPELGHPHAPARTKDIRKCPVCENTDKTSFKKGKPVGSEFIVISQEELDAAVGLDKTVTEQMVLTCCPLVDVEAKSLDAGKSYYLDPAMAADTYQVIVHFVNSNPQTAFLTEWAPRTKVGWYRLTVHNGALMLRQLVRPEDVKEGPVVEGEANPAYLAMAGTFVEALTMPFDPENFADTRRRKVIEFLAAQKSVAGADVDESKPTTGITTKPAVDNLMAAMQASIDAATKAKPAAVKAVPAKKAPARKAPAKKAS